MLAAAWLKAASTKGSLVLDLRESPIAKAPAHHRCATLALARSACRRGGHINQPPGPRGDGRRQGFATLRRSRSENGRELVLRATNKRSRVLARLLTLSAGPSTFGSRSFALTRKDEGRLIEEAAR
jgi:hypothetical protein